MTKPDFIVFIRDCVTNGYIEEALEVMLQNIRQIEPFFVTDVMMLNGQFTSAKDEFFIKGFLNY